MFQAEMENLNLGLSPKMTQLTTQKKKKNERESIDGLTNIDINLFGHQLT